MTQSLPGIPDSRYKMNHTSRGRVAIFVHQFYTKKEMKREGAEIDVSRLLTSLPKLGFLVKDISIYRDYTVEKIKKTLKNRKSLYKLRDTHYFLLVSEEDHSNKDCFLLIVLTHGSSQDIVHAHDHSYSIEELWAPFFGNRCKSLVGKPKFFFIVVGNLISIIFKRYLPNTSGVSRRTGRFWGRSQAKSVYSTG